MLYTAIPPKRVPDEDYKDWFTMVCFFAIRQCVVLLTVVYTMGVKYSALRSRKRYTR